MDGGPADTPSILAILGLTARRIFCIVSESVFLIGGIVVGFTALPHMMKAIEEEGVAVDPLVQTGIEWYWTLLVALAVHIILWPIVPRLLGAVGVALWWAIGIALPLLIAAVPGLFVISMYASVIQDL